MSDFSLYDEPELKQELLEMVKKQKLKKKMISILLVVLAVLLAFGAAWFSGRKQATKKSEDEIALLKAQLESQQEKIDELINEPIVVSPASPEISLSIIKSELQTIGELATVEYLFTDAAKFSDSKQFKNWNIPGTEKSFILKWNGVIKAGIKLNDVDIQVDEKTMTVIVTLPKAEILSYQVFSDSTEVLDEKNNIFNKITVDDKVKFDEKTEESMKKRAVENGLLDKANDQAKAVVDMFLRTYSVINENYTIEYR